MGSKFTSIWNEKKPARSQGRAGVASGIADTESGTEGGDSTARSLRALKVMLDRGLMTETEYEQRKVAIMAAGGSAGGINGDA